MPSARNHIFLLHVFPLCSSLRISPQKSFEAIKQESFTDSPHGFSGKPGLPIYYQLHIPKTGGSALTVTLQKQTEWLKGAGVVASESCYYNMKAQLNSSRGDRIITFLREPVMHVYSQFYQACFHRTCGIKKNIHSYIDYFDEVRDAKSIKSCYSAWNMQTRAFTCQDGGNHLVQGPQLFEEAKQNVENTFFVGILEHFQESLCVFYVKQHQELPSWCNCNDKLSWSTHMPIHYDKYHAPKHSLSDLTPTDIEKIRRFTEDDTKLYTFAKNRFLKEVEDIERHFGTKVLCDK